MDIYDVASSASVEFIGRKLVERVRVHRPPLHKRGSTGGRFKKNFSIDGLVCSEFEKISVRSNSDGHPLKKFFFA